MSTRYVWNRYSVNTSYAFEQADVENTSQSEPLECGVKDSDAGSSLFLAVFKSKPTPTGKNTARYNGTYAMLDGTNDRDFYTSDYPWAAVIANARDWAEDAIENDGFPRSPTPGNTYSGTVYLDESWETTSSSGILYHATSPNGDHSERWYPRVQYDAMMRSYYLTLAYGGSTPGKYIYEYEIETNYSQGSTLQGTVSSANSGAYPNNSSSGSSWYVYQGADSIDPAAVTLPSSIMGGETVTATVSPSAGKKYGGTVSYTWQYRLDGGAWQSLGSGTGTAQSLTVPAGTNTVEVQVRAADDLGFTSGTWVSSGAVSVTNNLSPTAPGSITVSAAVAGEPLTVTLTAASDPDGTVAAYVIERRVDGGGWQQVYSGPALTFTDTVGADWQSVQYRAAAVDNEGAQGPYLESEVLPVRTGAVTITGPASGQGEHAQPFDVGPLTLGVTPAPSDPAVQLTVLLDGAETVTASQAAGDEITLHIDPRVMARGAHTLTVTASKEAYAQAMAQYTYTVPAWDGSDIAGGRSGRLEDWLGRKMLPKTLAQDCLGPDGKDMASWIAALQQALGSLDPVPLEPVVRQAPPSGSFALSPGVLYDFTQADASALTFVFDAPESGKAAAYHVMFKCGSTAAAVTLPDSVRTPDGYVIEAGRVYELSVLEGLLTYQSWGVS